jgi:predicted ArsR family transcriptional regulator
MTTNQQIIQLLHQSPATTGAIAERLHMPCKVIDAYLQDLELEEQINSRQIAPGIIAWSLSRQPEMSHVS